MAPFKMFEKKAPAKIGDTVKGNYKILSELGRGGYGVVFKVEDLQKKKNFAMKIELDTPRKDEPGLHLEVCVLKRLQSCNHVVRYYDSGFINDKFGFLVMQLIARNLSELRRSTPELKFTLGTAIRLCLQALNAIEYMHGADFLHRDVKPGNFAMGKYDKDMRTVFILDFGMVRRYRLKGVHRTQRKKLGFRGTLKYASPNMHSNLDLSRRDDMYSWAYMLIEFLQGSLPWQGAMDKHEISKQKNSTKKRFLDGVLPEVTKIYDSICKLKWAEEPAYVAYRRSLNSVLQQSKVSADAPFDWEHGGKYHKEIASAFQSLDKAKEQQEKKVKEKDEEEESNTESS